MRTTLYLLTASSSAATRLIPSDSADQRVTVVLLQEGVALPDPRPRQTFVLEELRRGGQVDAPAISYADLLRMIFESDTVVTL